MGKVKRKRLDFRSSSRLKQRLRGGHLLEDGEDRISSLPDEILLLILSFLNFYEMAQTSLLSRRWLYLWVDTQVLHLDYPFTIEMELPSAEESQCFVNQVNNFLKLHRSQSLKEFLVAFKLNGQYKKDISSWVEYALARKVESLELNFLFENRVSRYSSSVFDFDEFLKLYIEKGVHIANPDKRLAFRSLKSLSLKCVQVTDESVDFILQNCPFLERLEVVGSWKLRSLIISDPKLVLKYLHIDLCNLLEFIGISNINLVSLNLMLYKLARGLRLTNLPMLVELSIWKTGGRDELRRVFSQSSSCLSQLRSLKIRARDLQSVTQLSELSRLTKLKRLVIKFRVHDNERLVELVSFIKAIPYLEEFVLALTRLKSKISMPNRTVAQPEKICSLKCLKVFEFVGYDGCDEDLELVIDIMKNSVALEKIVIDPRNPIKPGNCLGRTAEEDEECRSTAMQQFEGFRESTQLRIIIL